MKPEKSLEERRANIAAQIDVNREGWFAIRHRKEGWWVGTEKGVTCYARRQLAAVALTIIWQRDGGRALNFIVDKYHGNAKVDAGTYTPKYEAEEALKRYEHKTIYAEKQFQSPTADADSV